MIYAVTARLIEKRQAELHHKLTDGTIAAQRPDGMEIVASMRRARVAGDGTVRWTELCYCSPPLRHERETVLDRYFTDIQTEPAEAHARSDGRPLMDLLGEAGGLER